MTDKDEEASKKLGMSLDEIVKKSRNKQSGARGNERNNQGGRGNATRGGRSGGGQGRWAPNQGQRGVGTLPGRSLGLYSQQRPPFRQEGPIFFPMPDGFPMNQAVLQAMRNGLVMPPLPFPGAERLGAMPGSFVTGRPDFAEAAAPVSQAPAAVPKASLDDESGVVTVTFRGKQVIKCEGNGKITLNTGGIKGPAMFMALNAVLNILGISITRPNKNDDWSIQDGRSLVRFRDGVELPAKGPQAAQRGSKILSAFGGADADLAASATAASNEAAARAGIVLRKDKEKARESTSQAQGGFAPQLNSRGGPAGSSDQVNRSSELRMPGALPLLPPGAWGTAPGPRGAQKLPPQGWSGGPRMNFQNGSSAGTKRSAGVSFGDSDRQRRLRAQGRADN